MDLKPITSEEEKKVVLARLWKIFKSKPGTPEAEEAIKLTELIERFQEEHS